MEATPSSVAVGNRAARASARALKLASLPPLVKLPSKAPPQPMRSPIQRRVSCSILEASCERAMVASCGFRAATKVSASTATYAGVGFIKPK